MTSPLPLVSCIITTHNRVRLLPHALESVRAQTYKNIETIVVADGCTDGTIEYVRDLIQHNRLHLIAVEKAGGPSAARNLGILSASGEFVSFLDDDDEWVPHKIERQIELALQGVDFVTCTSAIYRLHGKSSVYGSDFDELCLADMFRRNCIVSVTPLIRTWLARAQLFDPRMWIGEDYDLWIRLLSAGVSTRNVSEPLIYYNRRPGESLNKLRWRKLAGRLRIYRKHRAKMNLRQRSVFLMLTVVKLAIPDPRYLIKSFLHNSRRVVSSVTVSII